VNRVGRVDNDGITLREAGAHFGSNAIIVNDFNPV
jgi:hypothetical protein